MVELHRLECVPCRSDEVSLSLNDIIRWHREIPKWEVKQLGGAQCLERVFVFNDFHESMTFTEQVASLARKQKHHPRIVIEYDKVTLHWWTHKVQGLHLNDFIMASKVDLIIRSYRPRR